MTGNWCLFWSKIRKKKLKIERFVNQLMDRKYHKEETKAFLSISNCKSLYLNQSGSIKSAWNCPKYVEISKNMNTSYFFPQIVQRLMISFERIDFGRERESWKKKRWGWRDEQEDEPEKRRGCVYWKKRMAMIDEGDNEEWE